MRSALSLLLTAALLGGLCASREAVAQPRREAGPAPQPAQQRAAQRESLKQLQEGRRRVQGKDLQGGIAAFKLALAARPDDPAILGELGWAYLQLGDLPRAEDATRRAITTAVEPRQRASLLYNLGLIEQRRGHAAEAANAFRLSLALRPSKAVQAALEGLPRASAPVRDYRCTLEGCGAVAPAPTLPALCARVSALLSCDGPPPEEGYELTPTCAAEEARPGQGSLQGWSLLRLEHPSCDGFFTEEIVVLAVRRGGAWHVLDELSTYTDWRAWGAGEDGTSATTLRLQDVLPGDEVELVVELTSSGFSHELHPKQEGHIIESGHADTSLLIYSPVEGYRGGITTSVSSWEYVYREGLEGAEVISERQRRSAVLVDFAAPGTIIIRAQEGEPSPELPRPGTYTAQDLLAPK